MLERINEVIQQTWVLLSKWYKSTTAITITTTTRHVTEMIGHAFDHWYFLFISGVNGIYPPWFSCLHFVFNSTQTTDCIWRCLYWSKNQIHRGCFVAYCTYSCTHVISYIVLYGMVLYCIVLYILSRLHKIYCYCNIHQCIHLLLGTSYNSSRK